MNLPFLKKFSKRTQLIITIAAVIIIILGVILAIGAGAPNIATASAEFGEFVIDINESGEIKAVKSVSVSVPRRVRGNLRIMALAEDGAMVEKGDFLVQFDTSEAQQRVDERENELANAQAELASLNANIASTMASLRSSYETQKYSYEQAKLRYEQMRYEAEAKRREQELGLKKADIALAQAKEKIESQKIIDAANITKAELKVRQAQMNLKQAKGDLQGLTLTAPIGGMVVLKEIWSPNGMAKVKVGDTPWRGMELVEIPDLSQMMIETKVNEVDISRVSEKQQVIITVDALHGPTFYGTVSRVATLATRERGSDVKVFEVEVTIEGADPRLKPGMTAQCQIITDRIPEKLYVPLECVFTKDDTTVVYVKKGGFEKRAVKVGAKNSDYVVIEKGLAKDEFVALRDPTLPLEELGGETPAVPDKKKKKQESSERMMIIG